MCQIITVVQPVDVDIPNVDDSPWAIQLESIKGKSAVHMEDIEDDSLIQSEVMKSKPVIKLSALKRKLEVPDSELSSPAGMKDDILVAMASPPVIPSAPKCKLAPLPFVSDSEPSSPPGDRTASNDPRAEEDLNMHQTTSMVSRHDL